MNLPGGARLQDLLPIGALIRALLMLVALADAVFSLQFWLLGRHHHHEQMAGEVALVGLASLKVLGALLLAAAAIYLATRPRRAFRRILLLLTLLAALGGLGAGRPLLVAIAVTDCLAALLAASLWPEFGERRASRLGWTLLGGSVAAMAWLFLLQRPNHRMAFLFTLVLVLAVAAALSAVALLDRNPPMLTTCPRSTALDLYRAHASSGISPFALMRDKQLFISSDRRAFLPFACRAGTALALGSAIGEPGSAAALEDEFRAEARRRGWRAALYQVPEEAAARAGRSVRITIGSEALVDVERLTLEGPVMARLRHEVGRARRNGVTARLVAENDLDAEARAGIGRIEQELVHSRPLGAMTFSVGRRDDPSEVERSFGLAYDSGGRLVAYVTWIWLPAASNVILDEMRRAAGSPPGTLDYLIWSCLDQFKGRARQASLGLAPLAGPDRAARQSALGRALHRRLGLTSLNPGLHTFKAKFDPRWERRYLLVDHLSHLPAALLATLLLHYPELGRSGLGRLSQLLQPRPAGWS